MRYRHGRLAIAATILSVSVSTVQAMTPQELVRAIGSGFKSPLPHQQLTAIYGDSRLVEYGDFSGNPGAERAVSPDDAALAAAFEILQTVEVPAPSIVALVDAPPAGTRVTAYRLKRADGSFDPTIYIVRSSQVFRRARAGQIFGVVLLASTLRHEMLHAEGADERQALLGEVALLREWLRVARGTSMGDQQQLRQESSALEREAQKYR